jgi:DNA polymerase elongation subunit (family B)
LPGLDISGRNILIFDIETVGDIFDELPEDVRNYLTKYANTDDKRSEIIESMVFNPLTSKIAAIGMMDYCTNKGCIMVNGESDIPLKCNNENFNYLTGTEIELIRKFWDVISTKQYNLFVTFNGREFDCPFIMIRSIFHRIKPPYNLMRSSDWNFREYHIDLLKEFTFYAHWGKGAKRKFNLDFYCHKFGIPSPKTNGITGDMVSNLYSEKKYQEIADYCIGDVLAECELFKFWNEYFNI